MAVRDAWARVWRAPLAHLGTIAPDGSPRMVPCCFALEGTTFYSAVDDKPKSGRRLARLDDVTVRNRAAVLVDHYEDDWERLWWVRASGPARVVSDESERVTACDLLRRKYRQYADHALDGPVLAVSLILWSSWSAAPDDGGGP